MKGARTGHALKGLQWFLRGVQFLSAALILSIYSYFLATLSQHNMDVPTSVRAVEGISGFAALYSILGICVLCCVAGFILTSFFAIVLDIAFAAAFIYVAIANRDGVGTCEGVVSTPFGTADAATNVSPDGKDHTTLPSFRTACKLESACLAVAVVAILFYIFSALTELALGRNRSRQSAERRAGLYAKENNYSSNNNRYPQGGQPQNPYGRPGDPYNANQNQNQNTSYMDPVTPQPQGFFDKLKAKIPGVGGGGAGTGTGRKDDELPEFTNPQQLNGGAGASNSRTAVPAATHPGPLEPPVQKENLYANKYNDGPGRVSGSYQVPDNNPYYGITSPQYGQFGQGQGGSRGRTIT